MTLHRQNLQGLATELFKMKMGIAPLLVKKLFLRNLTVYLEMDSGLVKLVVMTNLFFNNQQHETEIKRLICVTQINFSFFGSS